MSAAAEAKPSIVSHALLGDQVLPLATFSSEGRDGIIFADWYEQLELNAGLMQVAKPCQACQIQADGRPTNEQIYTGAN